MKFFSFQYLNFNLYYTRAFISCFCEKIRQKLFRNKLNETRRQMEIKTEDPRLLYYKYILLFAPGHISETFLLPILHSAWHTAHSS